jgi:2-polyprenyl-3-methyl-5-hydroxy-6-metoxy-1,4-benzoquinol methylase
MKPEEIKKRFQRVDLDKYPELRGLNRDQIYHGKMGPGGLLLAAQMSRRIPIRKDTRVMDVGCGRGATSVFLAGSREALVYSIDLWIPANQLLRALHTLAYTPEVGK